MDINETVIDNERGPTVWFTDPFGGHARPDSFPGAIRQWIARINTNRSELNFNGPTLGNDRRYGASGSGVHAPN